MAYKIQLRRDTAANWTNFDPVLSAGEAGLEIDTGKLKFGDGSTAWTSLGYFGVTGPGSSTDNAIVRWGDTGTGDTLQDSGVFIDDNDDLQIGTATNGGKLTVQGDGDDILSLRNSSGTEVIVADANGGLTSGEFNGQKFALSDDTAASFTPISDRGTFLLYPRLAGAITVFGLFMYRVTTGLFLTQMVAGSAVDVTTGALSGTTGADTKVTLSVHTDGKIYIENRFGTTLYIDLVMFGKA